MDVDNATVTKSRGGKTRGARSEWAHSQVFSSDEDEDPTEKGGTRASLWGDKGGKSAGPAKSHAPSRKVSVLFTVEPPSCEQALCRHQPIFELESFHRGHTLLCSHF